MRKKAFAGEPIHEGVAVRLRMPQSDASHFRQPFAFRFSVSRLAALWEDATHAETSKVSALILTP